MSKKIVCLILFIFMFSCITINCYAGDFDDIINAGADVRNADTTSDQANNIFGMVVRGIQYTGSGIALVVIMLYGIRYMLASPQDKADIKKQIVPIIIGCVLLFATVNIVGIVADTTNDIFGGEVEESES